MCCLSLWPSSLFHGRKWKQQKSFLRFHDEALFIVVNRLKFIEHISYQRHRQMMSLECISSAFWRYKTCSLRKCFFISSEWIYDETHDRKKREKLLSVCLGWGKDQQQGTGFVLFSHFHQAFERRSRWLASTVDCRMINDKEFCEKWIENGNSGKVFIQTHVFWCLSFVFRSWFLLLLSHKLAGVYF